MKFEPRHIEENVNVPHNANFKEFLKLSVWILGIILSLYLVLGFAAEKLAERLPYKYEKAIAGLFVSEYEEGNYPKTSAYLQQMLDRLVAAAAGLPEFPYKVHVFESESVNALALPAGNIVVFTGLLKELNSENELAMVLSHELGHYVHRDHLRGLGRSLVLALITTSLGISGNSLNYIGSVVQTFDLKFSREQEAMADRYALDLIAKVYGHAGGALEAMNILEHQHKGRLKNIAMFSSHPDTVWRMQALLNQMDVQHYSQKMNSPFPYDHRLPFADDTADEQVESAESKNE